MTNGKDIYPQRLPFRLEVFLMASAEVHPIKADCADESEVRVAEFEEGVRRGIEQCKTGQVKTFDDKAEFLNHLRNL